MLQVLASSRTPKKQEIASDMSISSSLSLLWSIAGPKLLQTEVRHLLLIGDL